MYYVVKYTGKFGFIKPWTAVRDGETFSQQFLTPSTIEGIEKKLFPELLENNGEIRKIQRHKLSYDAIDTQQEVTQIRGWKVTRNEMTRERSILKRGVMLNPVLYLAFAEKTDDTILSEFIITPSYKSITLLRYWILSIFKSNPSTPFI
mgnify:CR=1 FL=1